MRNLFNVNNDGEVVVEAQAWLYEPFAVIREKYSSPGLAEVELALVYHCADYRSEISAEKDVQLRIARVKNNLFRHRKLKIDDVTVKAIQFYEENQDTVKIQMVRAVNRSMKMSIDYLEGYQVKELDDIKVIADITGKLPKMVENLTELEKFVKAEKDMEAGIVGSGEKSMYEDDA